MRKSNNTQKALLTSAFALLMCVAMLVGTTFAWFTDTASTNVNKVQAGTLDVALEMWDGEKWVDAEGKTLNFVSANGDAEILWEPGCTYDLPLLRVKNNGNLAIKYQVLLTGINGDAKLNEAIEWSYTAGFTNGTFAYGNSMNGNVLYEGLLRREDKAPLIDAVDAGRTIKITGHMKETAGNEYQGLSIEGISITVVATQTPYETDSVDNKYDANATYPAPAVKITAAELRDLLTAGGEVKLDKDYYVTDAWTSIKLGNTGTPVNPSSINIDGQGHTIYGLTDALFACQPNATVTIKNLTISNANILGDTSAETNGLGTAAFVAYMDHNGRLTLDNCHVLNSTITATGDARVSGFVGYLSGDTTTVSITNSSVENCTITGDNGAAGLVAFTQCPVTVDKCSVKGNTVITCTEDREGGLAKAGKLFGTISYVDIEVTNTTVDSTVELHNTNATTAHDGLVGRLVHEGTFTSK